MTGRGKYGMSLEEMRTMEETFPAGLEQPAGSFRFSSDALLLADFALESSLPENAVFADLGTGCGVVALGVLRRRARWRGAGLEIQPELAAAAERNASGLGLSERFRVVAGSVTDSSSLRRLRAAFEDAPANERGAAALPLFDAVFCNPPWRREGAGRVPPSSMRRTALFGTGDTFPSFFAAADAVLKNGGRFMLVSGAERTADVLAALPSRLHAEHLRFVFTRRDAPAAFVLLAARKNGRASLRVDRLDISESSSR